MNPKYSDDDTSQCRIDLTLNQVKCTSVKSNTTAGIENETEPLSLPSTKEECMQLSSNRSYSNRTGKGKSRQLKRFLMPRAKQ